MLISQYGQFKFTMYKAFFHNCFKWNIINENCVHIVGHTGIVHDNYYYVSLFDYNKTGIVMEMEGIQGVAGSA